MFEEEEQKKSHARVGAKAICTQSTSHIILFPEAFNLSFPGIALINSNFGTYPISLETQDLQKTRKIIFEDKSKHWLSARNTTL